jgi:arginase
VATGERVGLVYFDLHADLNVPDSVPPGALDWMGVAHMLGEPGTRPELVRVGPSAPLLEPERLVLVGWGPEEAQPGERETIERERIEAVTVDDVRADPEGAAARALEGIQGRVDRLVIHFDVDVIDFTDTPLSENPGRNEGVAYDDAMRALAVLLGASSFAGLTVTELNPDHAEEGAGSIDRLARDLARALAAR